MKAGFEGVGCLGGVGRGGGEGGAEGVVEARDGGGAAVEGGGVILWRCWLWMWGARVGGLCGGTVGGVVSWNRIGNGEMERWYHCEVWDELISRNRDSLAVELMRNVEGLRRCSWCVKREMSS